MAFLPFLLLILITFFFYYLDPSDIRENLIKGFLICGFLILVSTEILSLFNLITYPGILSTWIGFNLIAIVLLVWVFKKKHSRTDFSSDRGILKLYSDYPRIAVIGTIILLFILGITLYISLKSPPNNYDSMTYHMARVANWIQNQNIKYYPTGTPRQNYSMPLAEFSILHLQILSKSDRYANLIQWFGFIMSILLTSSIAKQLKQNSRGQWITALITATLPIAILQSASTANDIITGVFCLSFAYFLGKITQNPEGDSTAFAGLALGLALATKGTAYVFCAGIGIGLGVFSLIQNGWKQRKRLIVSFISIITLGLLLNSGIYYRNLQLYNHPVLGSNERTLVDKLSPQVLIANIIRNSLMNLASPIEPVNNIIDRSTEFLLGDEISNPASTYKWTKFALSFKISEDDASNSLHLLLIFGLSLTLPWIKLENKKTVIIFFFTMILTFLFFCAAFKWQPWGVRLQIPIMLMGTIIIGTLLNALFGYRTLFLTIILVLLGIASIPYLFFSSARPLLPLWKDGSVFYEPSGDRKFLQSLERSPNIDQLFDSFLSIFYEGRSIETLDRYQLYFFSKPEEYYKYMQVCDYIKNESADVIGLLLEDNHWEYPIWVCLGQHASPGPRKIIHVGMENQSRLAQVETDLTPGLIIVTKKNALDLEILSHYVEVLAAGRLRLYELVDREHFLR